MKKKKRCLLITNHFFPETFRCNDIAFELVKRGYDVTVMTAIPDYPQGKFHEGYSLFKKRCEIINGVKVIRIPHIPRGNGNKVRMIIHYASVMFFFFFYALYRALFDKFDSIFIHNTSPAFICLPAILIKKIQRIPIDHWILDMWPESLTAGGINSKKVYSIVEKMMKMIYRNSDIIHISSLGFRKLLVEKGVPDEKIEYLPNFCEETEQGNIDITIPELPEGFKIMFAGNLGEAQNLENVLTVAKKLKERTDIHWIFVGDGRKKAWIEDFVEKNNLKNTVHLLGRWPIETMPAFFKKADVMLVSLADKTAFNIVLPAKVQAYMINAKPIVAMLNGEGQEVIAKANCGWSANSDDIDGMIKIVEDITKMPKEERIALGKNGYKYYLENFKLDIFMNKVENALERM